MPPITVILNAAGGSFTDDVEDEIRAAFEENGLDAEFLVAKSGDQIDDLAKQAVEGPGEIIVAGGGDGTISSVGGVVAGTEKRFGVLPLGTLNNFSKDLGVPQDVAEAVRVLTNGETRKIDTAEVNGRTFINNSSIGLYPRIVIRREQQQNRLGYGKWRAAFWAAIRIFRFARFLKVRIEIDGRTFVRKTPFLFVGNNRYEMDLYNIGRRTEMDNGKLSVYFLRRGGRWGVIVMLLRTLTGTLKQWRDFEEVLTEKVTIQTRRRRLPVAFDGEVGTLETPLEYRSVPGSLNVIVPTNNA